MLASIHLEIPKILKYVLDETSFVNSDGYEQITIFDDVTKELPTGYGERFSKYYIEISF